MELELMNSKIHPPPLFPGTEWQGSDWLYKPDVFFNCPFNRYINRFFHLAIYTNAIHSRIAVYVASLFK